MLVDTCNQPKKDKGRARLVNKNEGLDPINTTANLSLLLPFLHVRDPIADWLLHIARDMTTGSSGLIS